MNFAHPLIAAAAVLSIAIPILIHLLLRFRRRPVPWAAMRFLYEAYQKQRRKLKLQQILLLATRCLLLLAAGLAVARPFAGDGAGAGGAADVYVVLDNSLTSQFRNESGERALDRHIDAAQEMIDRLGAGDRAGIVTLAAGETLDVLPPSGDLQGVRAALERVGVTDAPADIEGALERVRSSIDASPGAARVVVLSEFRRGFFPPDETPSAVFQDELSLPTRLIGHSTADGDNVAIVEVEPQRSLVLGGEERETVRVRLRRFGGAADREATSVVRAAYVGGESEAAPVDAGRSVAEWAPGQSEQDIFVSVQAPVMVAKPGALSVSIDRDALAGDDTAWAPVAVAEGARVGVVDRAAFVRSDSSPLPASRWVELALQPDRTSRLQPVTLDPADLDATALAGLETVFVLRPDLLSGEGWSALARFVESGRSVVLAPPPDSAAHAWVDPAIDALGLEISIASERVEHEQARALRPGGEGSVELLRMLGSEIEELISPVRVFASLPIELDPASGGAMLMLDDGTPWVVRATTRGDGQVIVLGSAVSLEWSTLPATPLMVPLMQEVVREAGGSTVRQRVSEAGDQPAVRSGTSELDPIRSGDSLPSDGDGGWTVLDDAGVYRMVGARGEELGYTVANPATRASDTQATTFEESAAWLRATGLRVDSETGDERASMTEATTAALGFSSVLFLIALLLAVAESYMARRFSVSGSKA